MQKSKAIVGFFPLLMIVLEIIFGLSGLFPNPQMALCLFLMVWMVSWWIFEILPLGITALIPLFFLPFFGVMEIKQVSPTYANPVIYLFLGGFIIARALEKTNLDQRIALSILNITGRSDSGIVLGFVIATSFLSMWISNTATTVMMVPIAMSVIHFLNKNLDPSAKESLQTMAVVLFLSIAYSANIGGIMTPIGTPPNVVFLGYLHDMYNRDVDFWRWFLATVPIAVSLLIMMTYTLRFLNPFQVEIPQTFKKFIASKLHALGPISKEQRVTIFVFFLASSLWIFKGLIHHLIGNKFLNDTSIAVGAGVLLFFIPANLSKWDPVLEKKDISLLPWDIVLLFGGGMALASSLKEVGLIELTTNFLASYSSLGPYLLIVAFAIVALFLTEIMSNVALCVVALPLIMKFGETQGIDPLLFALPAGLCTSFAFSMPISTPPNAIVFGTNAIRMSQMLKAGLLLNIVALVLTITLGYYLISKILI